MRSADGKFTTGNPGRPRGAENEITKTRKEMLLKLVKAIEDDYLEDDLEALKPRDRIKVYLACHDFLLPKMRAISVEGPTEIEELLMMTPQERQEAIQRIKEQLNKKQNGR